MEKGIRKAAKRGGVGKGSPVEKKTDQNVAQSGNDPNGWVWLSPDTGSGAQKLRGPTINSY